VLAELPGDEADLLFCPREAAAVLRTPMPPIGEMPGLAVNRARTAPMLGSAGTDCPLGANIHRNRRQQVSLDADMRFRHTYLVGQTGTGKSTLLLHMILHDINQNRGVAVLDPHGTLIEQILRLYPRSREDDLIIVDVTDFERPVPFNVLRIQETDPLAYRVARDIIIDDIFAYLERTYDMKLVGGPIFETHFRGMLGLLLGLEPQRAPFIPNLMIFRSLYQNTELRQALTKRIGNRDISMEEFIDEITNARGDHEIRNLAQYITAKFNRFVSDISLRNITCQNEILDLEALVEKGKVLLFYLGKGRFGDVAAGLLASQIVSRLRSVVMKRGARAGARPFYLYADEFHMFADERFGELLAEARKFGLSLTIAHQYARQIPEKILMGILGNVGTVISFRVGPPDAQMLEPLFRPQLTARDLSSLPNFRAYIRSFGRLGQTPFSLEPPPPPGNGCDELAANLRQLSRYRHGRDRSLVEEEIAATYKAYKEFERGRFFV